MTSSPNDNPRSRISWVVLRTLLGLESLLLIGLLAVAVVGALGDKGDPMQNLSLVAMAALSLVWVVVTFGGAAKSRASWVRGSALTVHVLGFAAGTGCLQLGIGEWWLGFAIVGLALVGFFAAVLARPDARAELPA